MGWVRNDDDMLDHEKWRRALRLGGDGVLLLWMRLTSWCSRRLTDGEVPSDMVEEVGQIGASKARSKQLRALVDASLLAWCDPAEDTLSLREGVDEPSTRARQEGDVLVVVGYLQRNPSRASVLADRDRRAKSQQNYRDRSRVTGSRADNEPRGVIAPLPERDGVPARPGPAPMLPTEALESLSSPPSAVVDAPAAPPTELAPVREVFAEWQRVHEHLDAKLDAKRTARIRSALKLFAPDQLKQAIRGALKDDWLMGRDPKSPRKYDGLETILRDTAKIESLIDLETGKTKPPLRRPTSGSIQPDAGRTGAEHFRGIRV